MEHWSPEIVFTITWLLSALGGLAAELSSGKDLTPTLVFTSMVRWGALGAGLGIFVFEYAGGKTAPARVIACGFFVGGGVLKKKDIQEVVKRLFNITGESK